MTRRTRATHTAATPIPPPPRHHPHSRHCSPLPCERATQAPHCPRRLSSPPPPLRRHTLPRVATTRPSAMGSRRLDFGQQTNRHTPLWHPRWGRPLQVVRPTPWEPTRLAARPLPVAVPRPSSDVSGGRPTPSPSPLSGGVWLGGRLRPRGRHTWLSGSRLTRDGTPGPGPVTPPPSGGASAPGRRGRHEAHTARVGLSAPTNWLNREGRRGRRGRSARVHRSTHPQAAVQGPRWAPPGPPPGSHRGGKSPASLAPAAWQRRSAIGRACQVHTS